MFSTDLRIAGLSLRLLAYGPFDIARFRYRFAAYEAPSPTKDSTLRVFVEPQGKILIPPDIPYPAVKVYGSSAGFKMMREGLAMWIGRDGQAEAYLRGPEKYPRLPFEEDGGAAETPLRLLISVLLLQSGCGALFHACGHADPRGGILFLGQSGAGKTTLARQLPPDSVLSDDQVALFSGSTPHISPTPFVGVLGRTIAPWKAPLRGIVWLDHQRTGRLEPVPPRERLQALLGCLPLYARDAQIANNALQLTASLLKVPMLRGSFSLSEGALPWVDRAYQSFHA